MPTRAILNHLIQQNVEIQAQLQSHAGATVCLMLPLLRIQGRLDAQGFLQADDSAPQTTLHIQSAAIQKILRGDKPGVGDISVSGDQALGMALLPLLGALRYWPNDDIGRLFGDAAAGEAMRLGSSLQAALADVRQSMAAHISDYARESDALVVHRHEFNTFAEAVDTLRDDTARLQARIRRLLADGDTKRAK